MIAIHQVRSTRAEFAGGQPALSLHVWLRPKEIVALLGERCSGDQLFGFILDITVTHGWILGFQDLSNQG